MEPICRLPASGFTETPNAVFEWADQVVSAARQTLCGSKPRIRLWAYRHQGCEYLAADIWDEHEASRFHPITFVIGDDSCFDMHEPVVPDMSDALHMVGIVAEGLSANVEVGRRGNEVNEQVIARPLAPGETNEAMRTAGRLDDATRSDVTDHGKA
ncbi:TPA: hypothetical protein ACUNF5_002751 [Burkholderia orbicola]|nr:hypothetical protein DF039_30375 [Burkholderia cenocepacia]